MAGGGGLTTLRCAAFVSRRYVPILQKCATQGCENQRYRNRGSALANKTVGLFMLPCFFPTSSPRRGIILPMCCSCSLPLFLPSFLPHYLPFFLPSGRPRTSPNGCIDGCGSSGRSIFWLSDSPSPSRRCAPTASTTTRKPTARPCSLAASAADAVARWDHYARGPRSDRSRSGKSAWVPPPEIELLFC